MEIMPSYTASWCGSSESPSEKPCGFTNFHSLDSTTVPCAKIKSNGMILFLWHKSVSQALHRLAFSCRNLRTKGLLLLWCREEGIPWSCLEYKKENKKSGL